MASLDFETHQHKLATDNDYRRARGLGPLPDGAPVETLVIEREAATSIGVDPNLFRQIDAWDTERKACEQRAKKLKKMVDEAMDDLVEQYTNAGTDEIRLGLRKGTLHSVLRAERVSEDVTPEQVTAALRADGLEHYVTPESYNLNSISSWMRDRERERKPLPPNLAKVLRGRLDWRVGFTAGRPTETQARLFGAASSILDDVADGASRG
jgi:hypothetical protein